jgi:hypothetical protein
VKRQPTDSVKAERAAADDGDLAHRPGTLQWAAPLLLPMLAPWLIRLAWIGIGVLLVTWKLWPLLLPLGLLWLLMSLRRRREEP